MESPCIRYDAFKPIFSLEAAKGLPYHPLGTIRWQDIAHEALEKSFARILPEAGPSGDSRRITERDLRSRRRWRG